MPEPQRRVAEPPVTMEERQPLRLNASDRQRVVARFLKGLEPRERHLLTLRFFENLDDENIGSLTSMGPEEVGVRLRRLLCGVQAALLAEDEAMWRRPGRSARRA